MPWERFVIEDYKIYSAAPDTSRYPNIYRFIRLYWGAKQRATLWFYRDGTVSVGTNASFKSGGHTIYYARFSQNQFADYVDTLRNKKPVYFYWNESTSGVFLAAGKKPEAKDDLKSGSELGKAFLRHKDNEKLFRDPGKFKRVKK